VKVDNIGEAILRRGIGFVLVCATLLMGYWATNVVIATRFIDFFPADHHNVILSERFHSFGGAETLVLVLQVERRDIFNLATLKKVQKITQEVDWLPGVNHQEVFSLASYRVEYAQAVPGGADY
jgi:predicted RND superfamily exporter protein